MSRQPAEIRRGTSRSDAICNSAKRTEIVFHVEKSESASGEVPSTSIASHAFHSGRTAMIGGRYVGKRVARMETILNSWVFGSPTALNQTAGPVVSKRIKLNEELALSCWKLLVSLIFRGSICCAIHLHISRSHPGLANGPSLQLSGWRERVLRVLQIVRESSASRKDAIVSEEKGVQHVVGGRSPFGWTHSIAWKRVRDVSLVGDSEGHVKRE